jgi:hypothetical protein
MLRSTAALVLLIAASRPHTGPDRSILTVLSAARRACLIGAIASSSAFAPLTKAGAIGALGPLVASSTIHTIAQALRELITIDRYVKEPGNSPLIVCPNRAIPLHSGTDIVLNFRSRLTRAGAPD